MRVPATALLLLLVVAGAAAEEAVVVGDLGPEEIAANARAKEEAVLAAELVQLRAKVSVLESSIAGQTGELKSKDEGIETLEKVTAEMSQNIATLQSEKTTLQAKGSIAAEEQSGKAKARAVNSLLQKASEKSVQAKEWAKPHIENAKEKWIPVIKGNWITAKTNMEPYVQMVSAKSAEVYQASRDAISPHLVKAHDFADPYFQEVRKLSKPYIDQAAKASKPHVEKIATTLKPYTKKAGHAYENFLETATLYHQQTGELKSKDEGIETLEKVTAEMSQNIATLQSEKTTLQAKGSIAAEEQSGKAKARAVNSLLQKASEKSVQAKEWAKPHIENAKEKWIPVIKGNWITAKTNMEPYVQMVSAKSAEVYQASRDAISPHLVKAHDFADPYFQEVRKLSKPYIDQAAKASKPHVEKIVTTLKPYTKKAGHAYENFLETATLYHQQAQATILDFMHQHEFLKQFVTEESVWFLAFVWLLMPVYVLYILLTEILCAKKQKKSPRNDKACHGHRRHKRRHADK